ncbi:MAG TPA: IclR family transcriptional regulator C-terminal domain-containing protein [Microbacterium sp.]|uniref:IclR family transcriptional regulator domain-containing protein n=1 Tax=Microbacterium sp. TaxID=51671 RepID=UPI002C0A0260|nr:IclR family transcriptional regulator C-terminal domain-containing protein [Microbacterium sp.]HWI30810.1 IclR family transcriptional regulator C-terminal domain-containing protein [Microbacterium sp.]
MRQSEKPEFIEALARGLDVLTSLGSPEVRSLSEIASAAGLPRPTTRRILITLMELGYVRAEGGSFHLTPRVFDLGYAYLTASGIWEIARPHLVELSRSTGESCSIAQLDGSDVVYVARAAVPKLVGLSVSIGTRFPAVVTSLGKVLLADLSPEDLAVALAAPTRSGIQPARVPSDEELSHVLQEVRARGWAVADQQLAAAIRSIAAPIRNGAGRVVAAVNINAHAMETPIETLVDAFLPRLLQTAANISADWQRWEAQPITPLPTASS